mmetsp:Transcript_548/g.1621  ORF Transcript_548/g.1621 Transcript_548/m.1621 type:complete len:450 (+) Transcript_548:2-1351(+)
MLLPMGYFGPISARVRSLFVKHTRTGNPLVDSVAEHSQGSAGTFWYNLGEVAVTLPFGLGLSLFGGDAGIFLATYAVASAYFALKMSRLIVLIAPASAALAGVALGTLFEWTMRQVEKTLALGINAVTGVSGKKPSSASSSEALEGPSVVGKGDGGKPRKPVVRAGRESSVKVILGAFVGVLILGVVFMRTPVYLKTCQEFGQRRSDPRIVTMAHVNGNPVVVKDILKGFIWLRDNTPDDARILSWWDYGYQITGIANRTTLADGNTWNHEHIAMIGKILVSPQKEAHAIARHLADYVYVLAGNSYDDDLAKSGHMAFIGASVFPDLCPKDPGCRNWITKDNTPSEAMLKSTIAQMHSHKVYEGRELVDPKYFREVYKSQYGRVRIYKVLHVSKKSKEWLADPANKLCDREGSWYCPGQYPPALKDLISRRKTYARSEDFNRKREADAN